jgi:hypothetical protein
MRTLAKLSTLVMAGFMVVSMAAQDYAPKASGEPIKGSAG